MTLPITCVEVLIISDESVTVKGCSSTSTDRSVIADEAIAFIHFGGVDEQTEGWGVDETADVIDEVLTTKQAVGSSFVYTDEGGRYVVTFV